MKYLNTFFIAVLCVSFVACQQDETVEDKKAALKAKKMELQKIKVAISDLEKEISVMDPEFGKKNRKATLITTVPAEKTTFQHYVELSGSVKSRKNVLISAENMGNVNLIYVREGDIVRKGQYLINMDVELLQRSLDQLETEYALAVTMFEKQTRLWDQNIGTEVQYLEMKNRKESLERQIENIKTQISKSRVRAPFSGTIEEVMVREGEMAQPGTPLVRIINHQGMYIKADLSESYIGKFQKGDEIVINFPSLDRTINSKISSIGQVIDQKNRTFSIETILPNDGFKYKPNLVAVVKIKDFEKEQAVVIPSKLIQKDNRGDFIFVTREKEEEMIAEKVQIERGVTYKNRTIVLNGLEGGEMLVDEGFRDVANGTKIKVVENVL